MKNLLTALLLCASTIAAAQKTIINDPNAEPRTVSEFDAIDVSDGIDLFLSQGDKSALAVSAADPSILARIETKVVNNELRISLQKQNGRYMRGDKKMIAYISFRNLKKLSASGASDVNVNGLISAESLEIHVSGASDFKGKVEVNKLDIHQSGASDVKISGKAGSLKVDASGASDLTGYELETQTCNADASGASEIRVTVNNELNARASGASSIHYKGEGQVKQSHTSGASSIGRSS